MGLFSGGFRAYAAGTTDPTEMIKSIQGDTDLDDETRAELLQGIESKRLVTGYRSPNAIFRAGGLFSQDVQKISSELSKAKEATDPLYLGRKTAMNTRKSILSQPGRGQTILTR